MDEFSWSFTIGGKTFYNAVGVEELTPDRFALLIRNLEETYAEAIK